MNRNSRRELASDLLMAIAKKVIIQVVDPAINCPLGRVKNMKERIASFREEAKNEARCNGAITFIHGLKLRGKVGAVITNVRELLVCISSDAEIYPT